MSKHPIGIFDSGVGGLTVMQELMQVLPNERLLYFGDTARLPYGNKSLETIVRYSIENTICLLEKNIKLLVIACNTVSALALPKLRKLFNIPIIGVIEPGAEKAAGGHTQSKNRCVRNSRHYSVGRLSSSIVIICPQSHRLPPLLVRFLCL